MRVNELLSLPGKDSPEILLSREGTIIIKGRWMNGNLVSLSKPVIDWIDAYICDPAEFTCINISCEYFSGVSSAIMMSLLRKFLYIKLQHKKLSINWYYEEGDEDILEQGEHISSSIDIPFNFIMTTEYKSEIL
jgi:hypothetical protein